MSTRAADLMDLLALSGDELCVVLDADALMLLSGQLEYAQELQILTDLLAEPAQTAGPGTLRRWARVSGPDGRRPIDMLLDRDFAAFEDALETLRDRGFVIRGGGGGG